MPAAAARWMTLVLWAAAAYNLAWGSWVVLRPFDLFDWNGLARPLYPSLWQCVGMIVGVYGVGYAIAATAPLRHWPIVLVGLLGKLFGPLGFLFMWGTAAVDAPGRLPGSWAWVLLTNDLIWWVPFAAILYVAFRESMAAERRPGEPLDPAAANERFQTNEGETLAELSRRQRLLVVFLRHSGCTFCREALSDLAAERARLEAEHVRVVLVHMGSEPEGARFFAEYGLEDLPRVSDPSCELYRAYGLGRGRFAQLLGPAVWWRGFRAAILAGHGIGKLGGDGFQMPGVFLVEDNRIVQAVRHDTAAERPDYCAVATQHG